MSVDRVGREGKGEETCVWRVPNGMGVETCRDERIHFNKHGICSRGVNPCGARFGQHQHRLGQWTWTDIWVAILQGEV